MPKQTPTPDPDTPPSTPTDQMIQQAASPPPLLQLPQNHALQATQPPTQLYLLPHLSDTPAQVTPYNSDDEDETPSSNIPNAP